MFAPMISYTRPLKRSRARRGKAQRHRNPGLTVDALRTLLQQHGRERAAELLKKYPDVAEAHLGAIEARLTARGFLNKPLSAADAWAELAWLAPKVLAGEEATLVDAVGREFERASR